MKKLTEKDKSKILNCLNDLYTKHLDISIKWEESKFKSFSQFIVNDANETIRAIRLIQSKLVEEFKNV